MLLEEEEEEEKGARERRGREGSGRSFRGRLGGGLRGRVSRRGLRCCLFRRWGGGEGRDRADAFSLVWRNLVNARVTRFLRSLGVELRDSFLVVLKL